MSLQHDADVGCSLGQVVHAMQTVRVGFMLSSQLSATSAAQTHSVQGESCMRVHFCW
jgi:hypothetical protein